jgi:hypothetical protein
MSDGIIIAFLFVGMPFVIIAVVSWVLHYFAALNSPPTKRAAWIVGIGYLAASAMWLFGGPEGDRWEGPFAAIPGALLVFWWWRRDFRDGWIDDAHGVPEGVELANTDWRIGLVGVAGLMVAATIKVMFLRSAVGH